MTKGITTISVVERIIRHFDQRVRDITAETKEEYDKELVACRHEAIDFAGAVTRQDYIMMPATAAEDTVDSKVKAIADAATKRERLPLIKTDTTCVICLHRTLFNVPEYVDFSKTPHVTIRGNGDFEQFAQKKMTHLLMTLLLAMPRGKVRLHFIDLGFSGKAQFFVDNFDKSICDICFDANSAIELSKSLKEKMTLKLKGELTEDVYDFVVFIDIFHDFKSIANDFRLIFEKGNLADIHAIVVADKYTTVSPCEDYDLNLLHTGHFHQIDGYRSLNGKNVEEEADSRLILSSFSFGEDSLMRSKCVEYLNDNTELEEEEKVDIDNSAYAETSSVIEAPIGKTPTGDVVNFKIDVNRGHYHAFVIGETGSGKSRFLHDIIINMIVKYSPEDVELYLMDFKGVEFNPYRDIKHSRVILVDRADERITYEVIHELKQKMEERQKILAAAGASDVDEYNKMSADSHISQIILVADECQTLFSDDAKNNKLQRDMIATIALIAQQGRAYGVHLLLATQSLSNAPQLGASILNQIGEHYILPCLPADAQKLVPDHERKDTETVVSQMEKGKGQCYYQGADGKFLFTFSYIPKGEVQDSLIEAAKKKSDGHKSNGQVYFSGSLQYAMDEQTIDVIAAKGRRHIVASPGQSIAISQTPLSIVLRDEAGENMLLLGINDKQYVTRTTINTLVSMIASARKKGLDCQFVVIDCLKCDEEEPYMHILDSLEQSGLCRIVAPRQRKHTLYSLCKDIAAGTARPTVLVILGEETFRELKFDESLDIDANTKPNETNGMSSADNMSFDDALAMMNMLSNPVNETDGLKDINTVASALKYILERGPENAVHTVMQMDRMDNYYIGNENGYVGAKTIYSHFAHIILLRSGEQDVLKLRLPDDINPAALEDNADRLRAYYYNESGNRYSLLTPYVMPSIEQIDKLTR